jgi:tetratricopeptide (TPR) repeat protein
MKRQDIHPLAKARAQRNLTCKRLSQETGIGESTIHRAEHHKPVSAEVRRILCDYFGMSAQELGLKCAEQNALNDQTKEQEASALPVPPSSGSLASSLHFAQQASSAQILAASVVSQNTTITKSPQEIVISSGSFIHMPSSLSIIAPSADTEVKDWEIWFAVKVAQLITTVDHWHELALYCDRLQTMLDREIITFDAMKPPSNDERYTLSRRQALITLATLPSALCMTLQLGQTSSAMIEKVLTRCAASITSCWHLLKGSELALVEQILSSYIFTLVTLAQQPSRYRQTAARLASQAYRLWGIVALHRNNLKAREMYGQQALYFSEIAANPSLVVSAQTSLGSTLYYDKRPIEAAHLFEQALATVEDLKKTHSDNAIPPLQCSRVYAELAVVYAQQKREQEALRALGSARDLYPDYPENDPSFLYADFSPASMILEEGLTYLALAQHFPDRKYKREAWNSFARIDKEKPKGTIPERIFFEIANRQAETALVLEDLKLFEDYIKKGIEGAQQLQSKQRHQEANEIYEQALALWPGEASLKQLQDLFH